MPVTKEIDINVESVMYLDEISMKNSGAWPYGAVVGTKIVGQKWVVIRDINGHLIQRCAKGTSVNVNRDVPTEEEALKAMRIAYSNAFSEWMLATVGDYKKYKKMMMEHIEKDPCTSRLSHVFEHLETSRIRMYFINEVQKEVNSSIHELPIDAAYFVLQKMVFRVMMGYYDPNSTSLSMNDACQWIEYRTNRTIIREMVDLIGFKGKAME